MSIHRRDLLGGVAGAALAGLRTGPARPAAAAAQWRIEKVRDLVLYQEAPYYCAFPSVVTRPDGELLVAFRRAPNRRLYGETAYTHVDANAQLVLIRSRDHGATWSREPALIYAHPFGGSQDPCMVQLRDGSILCTSYLWAPVRPEAFETFTRSLKSRNFVFCGGYLLRSEDGGRTWSRPIIPPPLPTDGTVDAFGNRTPPCQRGAMCESRSGKLYWAVQSFARPDLGHSSLQLLVSSDRGTTWHYACPVAADDRVVFNETSLYETDKGDLVAFMRTANFDDHTAIARSTDGGRSFTWQDAGFQGHPHHALRLPDGRVLLVYGYRHEPYGIRARVLDPECRDFKTADEIVLRDDGGGRDLGYPWATLMADGRVLVVYYFNKADGLRHIAGTILSV
jgi:hypothetical protein